MNVTERFNALNGRTVTRIELEKIINKAKHENAVDVVYRISKILNENPNTEEFEINITEFEIEPISPTFLAGIPFEEINEENVGLSGLAAAVSPDQIYTMVTQKMLEMMKKASGKGYKKAWGNKNNEGLYCVPYNFVSKKPYQGINFFMLKNGDIFSYLENPYFLTFKQIENLGGKLKKGSKGYEVIYYTNLYLLKKEGKTIFGAYNYEKIKNYLKENNLSEDDVRKYPILKYYNVFNGKDIEGIDFKLEKSAVPVAIQPEENENPYGESIVKYYPTCPRITHGGDKAFYHPARDFIQLPKKENFDTSNDYFRTLFHEMAHSTGHKKRLNRDLSGSFGSKKYAFEELIAEFTSVFVSAHAGIVWYGNKNHAEYLKNWSKVIGEMEKDNKFVVKAAAQAQKAANYILDCNENGEPAFYKDFFKEEISKKGDKQVSKKKSPIVAKRKLTEKDFLAYDFDKLKLEEEVNFSVNNQKNELSILKRENNLGKIHFNLYFTYKLCEDCEYRTHFERYNDQKTMKKELKSILKKDFNHKSYAKVTKKIKKSQGDSQKDKNTKKPPVVAHNLDQKPTDVTVSYDFSKEENVSAKRLKELLENKKFKKSLTIEKGFLNTDDFFKKAPKGKAGLESLKKVVSKDDLRPVLTGVYTEKDFYVATDAHILVKINRPKNDGFKTNAIVDLRYYNEEVGWKNTAFAKKEDFLKAFRTGGLTYINGVEYPNYEAVIPKENKYFSAYVKVENILNHLYSAMAFKKHNVTDIFLKDSDKKFFIRANIENLYNAMKALYDNGNTELSFEATAHNRVLAIKTKNESLALVMPIVKEKECDDCDKVAPIVLHFSENKDFTEKGLGQPQKSLFPSESRKNTALAMPKVPFFENLKEAKKYFLAWALKHLRGKKIYHKELEKWVVFNRKGIEHSLSNKISLEKMELILQAEEMLKKSHFLKFEEENKGRENIRGVYRMQSIGVIEGKEKEVIITLREGENGVIYYDHKVEIKTPLPTRKSNARPKNLLGNGVSDHKVTKKSETSKKTDKKNGLGLPLTDEIRKKAFTEKGKLRKGWYYEENGLLTNGKEFYIKDLEYAEEYNAIKTKIAQRNDPKSKELWDLYKQKTDEENQDYRKQRVLIIDELSSKYDVKNKQDFNYFLNKFILKDELRKFSYIDRGEENKRMEFFKDLAKPIDKDKYTFTYSLTPKGEEVISEYLEKVKELFIKIHGNPKKIKKKYGLSAPSSPTPPKEGLTPLSLGEAVSESEEVVGVRNLAQKLASRPTQWEFFQIDNPQMANFLGKVEKKAKDSLVITLAGSAGSGKTRFAFQFINDLAQNYKVGHISMEEEPDSFLYYEKVEQYFNEKALQNIETYDIKSLSELDEVIQRNDVIVIDSFQKIIEIENKFILDVHLRKKYDGKLFLIIYQLTSGKKMRGGSKSEFDGDIILYVEKFDDYRENYVYPDKNRYNSVPANELKYSIFEQRLLPVENPQVSENQSFENLTFDVVY